MTIAPYRVQPVFRLLVPHRRQAAAPSMRSRTDARIVMVQPICQVVAALCARAGMVRYFIGRKAGFGHHVLGQFVKLGAMIRIHSLKRTAGGKGCKSGPWLNRQLIQGQVFRSKGKGLLEFLGPLPFRLLGAGIDQVKADTLEDCLGRVQG